MKSKMVICIAIAFIIISFNSKAQDMRYPKGGNFDLDKDLLLAHFDSKFPFVLATQKIYN